ncbi:EsaB/YukD family protein [Amphibacillus cookii]|uniref:EsaB/YukD family protein n=1 Tax=Amphibacillus cookii TaxID=767787 RepID=UPI00195D4271|nr:EsaB/YukD family protein [Amphibacillus cookii]MBM7541135.1 putative ubiquitin-like protein YukD [Amphibacillus cookii]
MKTNHIDVTVDLSGYGIEQPFDLRIPVHITIKQLIINIADALRLESKTLAPAIRVKTKEIMMMDDDMLTDYPIATGDILTIIGRSVNL